MERKKKNEHDIFLSFCYLVASYVAAVNLKHKIIPLTDVFVSVYAQIDAGHLLFNCH